MQPAVSSPFQAAAAANWQHQSSAAPGWWMLLKREAGTVNRLWVGREGRRTKRVTGHFRGGQEVGSGLEGVDLSGKCGC